MTKLRTKADSIPSAGTAADSEQKDEDLFVSQHSSKPNVGCSLFSYALYSLIFSISKLRKFSKSVCSALADILIGEP